MSPRWLGKELPRRWGRSGVPPNNEMHLTRSAIAHLGLSARDPQHDAAPLDDLNATCKVEAGRGLAVAGLHPKTGGSGLELSSGDMLLEALIACAGVAMKAAATVLDIPRAIA